MQKIERWIKQNVWISEMDGSEHLTEKQCRLYEKDKYVRNFVEKLQQWEFWESYDIVPFTHQGRVFENLGIQSLQWSNTYGAFLLGGTRSTSLYCKVSIRGNRMALLLFTYDQIHQPQDWKFLGEVDLRQVYDETSAKYYNEVRKARIAREYENKQIQRRSGLSKLTQEEKKALNLL